MRPTRMQRFLRSTPLIGILLLASVFGVFAEGDTAQPATSNDVAAVAPSVLDKVERYPSRDGLSSFPDLPSSESVAGGSTYTMVSPATSLYEFVSQAHVVILGTIDGVAFERGEGPYSEFVPVETPSANEQFEEGHPPPPERPLMDFTYFELRIEQILLDDGRIEPGGTLSLRIDGSAARSAGTYGDLAPFPEVGSTYLFALGINPDHASYGTRGPWGRINISDAAVTYDDWERTPVPFASGMTPEQFLTALEAMVHEVQLEHQRSP